MECPKFFKPAKFKVMKQTSSKAPVVKCKRCYRQQRNVLVCMSIKHAELKSELHALTSTLASEERSTRESDVAEIKSIAKITLEKVSLIEANVRELRRQPTEHHKHPPHRSLLARLETPPAGLSLLTNKTAPPVSSYAQAARTQRRSPVSTAPPAVQSPPPRDTISTISSSITYNAELRAFLDKTMQTLIWAPYALRPLQNVAKKSFTTV